MTCYNIETWFRDTSLKLSGRSVPKKIYFSPKQETVTPDKRVGLFFEYIKAKNISRYNLVCAGHRAHLITP